MRPLSAIATCYLGRPRIGKEKAEGLCRPRLRLGCFTSCASTLRNVTSCTTSGPAVRSAVGPECTIEAINLEARKDDNRKKLAATRAAGRRLFVYVDALNFLPWVGVRDFDPAGLAPSLPAEITDVWAAAGAGRPTQYSVWRGDSTGWRSLGSVVMDDDG